LKMASELRGLSLAFRWTGAAARKVKAEKSTPSAPPPADEAPLVSRRGDDEEGSLAMDSRPPRRLTSPGGAALLRRARAPTPASGPGWTTAADLASGAGCIGGGSRGYSGAASASRSEERRSATAADQPVRWGFGRQASTGPASHTSGQLEQLALTEAWAPAGGACATPS